MSVFNRDSSYLSTTCSPSGTGKTSPFRGGVGDLSLSRSSKLTIIDKFYAILLTPWLMDWHVATRIFKQSLKLLVCFKRVCRCLNPFVCFFVIPDEYSKLMLSAFKTERIVRNPVFFHDINDESCQFPREVDVLSRVCFLKRY